MTDAEAGNSDSRINVMSVEDLSQTMAATVSAVSKMGEQVSKIANEIGDVKKAVEASANNSTTIKAMGLNDKDKKDGKKMEKDASATREMITKMSESIFAAAAESDPDKRMAAIQDALGGDTITRKVASLEAAIASQSHTIAVQNAELSRPRVEFLEKAYGESGAGEEQVATLKASWEKMPIDTLDEEISKVRLLQSNSLRPAAGGPPLLAASAAAGSGAAPPPADPPEWLRAPLDPVGGGYHSAPSAYSTKQASSSKESVQDLFMKPFRERV